MADLKARTEHAQALIDAFEAGLSVRAAAKRTGAARTTAARWHRRWRAVARRGVVVAVGLRGQSASRLAAHAAKNGLSLAELVGRIAEAAADDGLVEAVLLEFPRSR